MEVVLWGRIWIRLSSGDPSSSRINALKFFGFTLNDFKETAKAVLWMPGALAGSGTWKLGRQQVQHLGARQGTLKNQGWMEGGVFLDCPKKFSP